MDTRCKHYVSWIRDIKKLYHMDKPCIIIVYHGYSHYIINEKLHQQSQTFDVELLMNHIHDKNK